MTAHVRAPVRVDFAGGWSDVPVFADEFGGAVLNAAITRYVTVDVQPNVGMIELSADELDQQIVYENGTSPAYDGTLDLHKAAVRMFPTDGGVRVKSSSSVPPGSGLGTSGALDVALVAGLSKCFGKGVPEPSQLAELAFRLEAVELGLTGGRQDQYASAFGGFLRLEFSKDQVNVTKLRVAKRTTFELQNAMVVAYTGQTHFSSETHDHVWAAFHEGVPRVREALHTIRDLVAPAANALELGDWRRLADLVDENWSLQQRLHPSIATPVMRSVETAARSAGAWGVKATGAGAGGCMIFIGDPNSGQEISNAVTHAGGTVLPYEFDSQGVCVT